MLKWRNNQMQRIPLVYKIPRTFFLSLLAAFSLRSCACSPFLHFSMHVPVSMSHKPQCLGWWHNLRACLLLHATSAQLYNLTPSNISKQDTLFYHSEITGDLDKAVPNFLEICNSDYPWAVNSLCGGCIKGKAWKVLRMIPRHGSNPFWSMILSGSCQVGEAHHPRHIVCLVRGRKDSLHFFCCCF